MARKGKSAIAHTIADRSDERGILGYFFCIDRTRQTDRYRKIYSTIGRDLAHRNPLVRRALARTLDEDDELRHTGDLRHRWTKLIKEPIRKASKVTCAPVLIVIDALDESGTKDTRRLPLQLVSGKQTDASVPLPSNFPMLITSRLLPDIYNALRDQQCVEHVSLHDVATESTERDVGRFIAAKLEDWLIFRAQDYATLMQKSSGIFEWAGLSCEHIANSTSIESNPRSRFDALISGISAAGNLLDDMYRIILTAAISRNRRMDSLRMFRALMGQVLALLEPLSRAPLTAIRQRISSKDGADVESVIRPLGVLLTGTTDDQTPIKPLHASFYDFLTDESRSKESFVGEPTMHHQSLAFVSLRVMKAELRFNICGLKNSYLPNAAVTVLEESIIQYISPELQYSCRFWMSHVKAAKFASPLAAEIEYFLTNVTVLFYLEVLSLTQSLSGTASLLSSVIPWIKDYHNYAQIRNAITDTEQLIRRFAAPILRSTPHLYFSALPSAPT
ncbi:uncharacterized protein FIBRA_08252 [Fibroporia radiculosa]|uniref:Nephrocystin 3-like N-terminal domain-containing protein n=1 Tax=Fibroporia radiculosa TaxID=599839 RepID=J4H527_9APHY|nr:uncharacterized protein FIBRA_08252 [Fibroporia radiculosa]CCM06009.1 predicted protein [Fibroporia radiculosa]